MGGRGLGRDLRVVSALMRAVHALELISGRFVWFALSIMSILYFGLLLK